MPPPLCAQARKFLDFLAAHPQLTRQEVEKEIGSGTGSAERWAATYKEAFRGEEVSIRARFKIAEAKRLEAARRLAAGGSVPDEQPRPTAADDNDPGLERFLALFAELRHRTKAIAQCQVEGFRVELEDVQRAVATDKVYRTRFLALMDRVLVEIEDGQIEKGRKGGVQSALAVLRAKRPDEYGNRLRVTVSGGLQLSAGDRGAVEEAKGGALRKFRQRSSDSAARLPGGAPVEDGDTIEGTVVEELLRGVN